MQDGVSNTKKSKSKKILGFIPRPKFMQKKKPTTEMPVKFEEYKKNESESESDEDIEPSKT